MNELQNKLLNIMIWFHEICEKNNLTYFMLGGTMLGAVRHKGFIPWDDDMDVGMPRKDYMKFISLTSKLDDKNYLVESIYKSGKGFSYPACKIYDKTTTLIEHTRRPLKRGIFLDVFPLDAVDFEPKKIKSILLKHKFLLAQRAALRKGRKLLKNLSVAFSRVIPYSDKLIIKRLILLDKKIINLKTKNSSNYANFYGAWGIKEVIPISVFGRPKLYEFEGKHFYGPERFDDYLRNLYSNYLELPPIEKRKTHHDFIMMDLEKPF